nr:hypothetical protein [uncultured Ruminococcus sp.]
MNLKNKMRNVVLALSDNRLVGRKQLAISYTSLFLAFVFMVVTTMAWFTVKDTVTIDSDTFSLESSSALRVNDGEDNLSNHIVVSNFKLAEASSVDGRNMFFPSEGNISDITSEMKFREGTAGDRNQTYVYKDFKLNADSDMTNVYIKGYNILIQKDGNTIGEFNGSTKIIRDANNVPIDQVVYDGCPLRLAFITDSSKTPIVIDPSALIDQYAKNFNAVSSTRSDGSPTTALTSCQTFSDFYFYSGRSLFTLMGQQPLDVTLVAWFEGAYDDQTVYEKYAGATVTIDIELESNYDDMEAITFVDRTKGDNGAESPWIKTGDCIVTMQYKDTDSTEKTVVMKYLGKVGGYDTWTAALPKGVTTDISFFRFSTTNNVIYNSWHTKNGVNSGLSPTAQDWIKNDPAVYKLQESRIVNGNRSLVYTARRGNGYGEVKEGDPECTKKRLSPCLGYWDYDPNGSTEETTSSTTETTVPTTTTPGGDSVITTVNTSVYLQIPDNKKWMRQNITSGQYEPYVIYNYNGKRTEYKMTANNDASKCSLENQIVPAGSRINGFKLIKTDKNHTKLIPAEKEYIFSGDWQVTYSITNDDKATYY